MDPLIARIRRVPPLRDISDHLLMGLLKYSERIPDRIANGVIRKHRIRIFQKFFSFPTRRHCDILVSSFIGRSRVVPNRKTIGNKLHKIIKNEHDTKNFSQIKIFKLRNNYHFQEDHYIETLSAGCIFGEIDLHRHSCSARVKKTAEFVRINQQHFLATYNVCIYSINRDKDLLWI